jgi:type VI protein secretion system component VasK
MRWIRYLLRLVLVVLVLVDVKLLIRLVAPPDDHFFKPTATDWLLTGLTCVLFLCVQGFIVWVDIRLGRSGRGRESRAVEP